MATGNQGKQEKQEGEPALWLPPMCPTALFVDYKGASGEHNSVYQVLTHRGEGQTASHVAQAEGHLRVTSSCIFSALTLK